MKRVLPLLIITLLTACNTGKDTTEDAQQFFVINYETALGNKKTINLTDVAASVRYIPLQTDSNCLLDGHPGYHFSSDYIFIEKRDRVLMFDQNGKFIRKIGTPGKGPNEIDFIRIASVLEKEKLVSVHTLISNKLLFYDYEGRFVESHAAPGVFQVNAINKDTLLAYDLCAMGFENFFFRLTNTKNDTIDYVFNPFKWENNTGNFYMITYWSFYPFYSYGGHHYFKCMHNDTVYTISKGAISPAYLINLGKYQLPIELRSENPAVKEAYERIYKDRFFASSVEASGKIYITSCNYADDLHKNIIYDKETNEGIYLTKEYDESSGIINDWDNGPEFWPEGNVNDNTLYMALSPIKIKELVESDEFKTSSGNEKNKKVLTELAKNLKEDDNAVLMLVTLK